MALHDLNIATAAKPRGGRPDATGRTQARARRPTPRNRFSMGSQTPPWRRAACLYRAGALPRRGGACAGPPP